MRPRIYKNAAEKLRVWRQRQKERRLCAIRLWVLPPKERAHLLRDVPWLNALSQERDELRSRLSEAERYATIGRSAEAQINRLLDRVAQLEQRERRRAQNRDRKRRRREGGVIVDSDPGPIRKHYQQPSAFAPIAPTSPPAVPDGAHDGQRTAFSRPPGPSARPAVPAPPAERPWWQEAGLRTTSPIPRSAPPPDQDETQALERIRKSPYSTVIRGTKVLSGGELLTPSEWWRRNGSLVE